MNGGETIINRIKADCDESVASIRLDAEKANAAVLAEAEKQAQLRRKEIADSTKQKIAQIQAASKSRSELAARTALLKQRRAEIDKTAGALLDYLTGLGDNDYFNALYRLAAQLRGKSGELLLNQKDLQRLPSDFENRVREAGLDARVSQTPADISTAISLRSKEALWLYHTNIPSAPSAREKSIC